jgi:hypothetical protein
MISVLTNIRLSQQTLPSILDPITISQSNPSVAVGGTPDYKAQRNNNSSNSIENPDTMFR